MNENLIFYTVICRCKKTLLVFDPEASAPMNDEMNQAARQLCKQSGLKFIRSPTHHCSACHLKIDLRRAIKKHVQHANGTTEEL